MGTASEPARMRAAVGRRQGRKTSRRARTSALDNLEPAAVGAVLCGLLAAHPDLRTEAERLARGLLGGVLFESVAEDVELDLRTRDLEDLNDRAGKHSWGYVDPGEAASEILDEALEPHIEEMKRLLKLGMHADALKACEGILLGLYRVRAVRDHDVLGWAPDFPHDSATEVLETWGQETSRHGPPQPKEARRRASEFPGDFVDRRLPEWRSMFGVRGRAR